MVFERNPRRGRVPQPQERVRCSGSGGSCLQQFIQQRRSRLVEGGADRHLHRLQVQVRGVVTLRER